jgi:hypothetical protein
MYIKIIKSFYYILILKAKIESINNAIENDVENLELLWLLVAVYLFWKTDSTKINICVSMT